MRNLLASLVFITNVFVLTPQAYGLPSLEAFCSNATATVVYQVSDVSSRLFVTKSPSSVGGNILNAAKIELSDFKIDVVSDQELESTFTSTCDQVDSDTVTKGVKTLKNLSFKRIRISQVEGERLPEGILGLSEDGMTMDVEYICDERIHEEVACE